MMIRLKSQYVFILMMVVVAFVNTTALAAEVPRMTKEELKGVLDDPKVVVLDLRAGRDWKSSEFKIKALNTKAPKNLANGLRNTRKIKNWCYIVPDRVKRPVSVWHVSL